MKKIFQDKIESKKGNVISHTTEFLYFFFARFIFIIVFKKIKKYI